MPGDPSAPITGFDYRVLAPREMIDVNGNRSEVIFDALGLPTAMAVKGKETGLEGDRLDLTADLIDPDPDTRVAFFMEDFSTAEASRLLGSATVRHLYSFGETRAPDGTAAYGSHPPCAAAILRETHVARLADGEASRLQVAFEYSDGSGNVLVRKAQAESGTPDGPLRWIASGKAILNNKGKPVKQYEPYFSETGHRFDRDEAGREAGVTPLLYYDALGRVMRTELPDGSFSRVEFSPWHNATFDTSDTVLERGHDWYLRRTDPAHPRFAEFGSADQQRAARLAAWHADTPTTVCLDSLGRDVISVAHNRVRDEAGAVRDDRYVTFTRVDAEGKPLWIRDARGNLVMQYITPLKPARAADEPDPTDPESLPAGAVPCYDIAGRLLHQHSMDAGDRWMINDAAGEPLYAWDVNERVADDGSLRPPEDRVFRIDRDELRRPVIHRLSVDGGAPQVVERFVYGDAAGLFPARPPGEMSPSQERNLRGQVYRHYDPSGLVTNERFDFKGNPIEVTRRLSSAYDAQIIHWPAGPDDTAFERETFARVTEYDALNRIVRLYNWHRGEGTQVAVYEPRYNARGMLVGEDVVIGATRTREGYVPVRPPPDLRPSERTTAIRAVTYNEKGQRTSIQYGNGATTTSDYDPDTFRLTRLRTTRITGPSLVQDLRYTYDPVGNVTEIRDAAQQTVYFANAVVEPRGRYEYDALYRLVRAEGREHAAQNHVQRDGRDFEPLIGIPFPNSPDALQNYTEQYEYDAAGNILRMRHVGGGAERWTRRYQYAADSNRLLATSLPGDPPDALSGRCEYDRHGSMLNLTRTPVAFRLQWDFRDMIHRVALGGGGRAWYSYDAGKRRTRKRVERIGNVVEERVYLAGMERYRRTNGGVLEEEIETLHLFADDERVLIVEDVLETDRAELGERTLYRYQLGNHLGSACAELDDSAAVITYEEYHPYGTSAYRAGRTEVEVRLKRYRYTGMERDEETGLNYHTARYYASWLGRWTAADPIGVEGGLNAWMFVRGNPVRLLDPSGLQDEERRRPPNPPPRPGHTPFGMIVESESGTGNNWRAAVIAMVGRRYGTETYEATIAAFRAELAGLPEGPRSREGTNRRFASEMFNRVRNAFYVAEGMNPTFDYSEEQLQALRRGAPYEPPVQIHHIANIQHEPERALDVENMLFVTAGESGGLTRGTPHWLVHYGAGARRLTAFLAQQAQAASGQAGGGAQGGANSAYEALRILEENPSARFRVPAEPASGTSGSGSSPARVRVEVVAEEVEAAAGEARATQQAMRASTRGAATIESLLGVIRVAAYVLLAYQLYRAESVYDAGEAIIDFALVSRLPPPAAAFYLVMARNRTSAAPCELAGSGYCELQWELQRRLQR
jgi:RHS repeat-associated protein